MKFLCLSYYDTKKCDALADARMEELVRQSKTHDEKLRKTGKVEVFAFLSAPQHWKSIRPANGEPSASDGPHLETKEVAGAFFIIEADDMEEAVEIASMHSAARLGASVGWGVDVRPCEIFDQGS